MGHSVESSSQRPAAANQGTGTASGAEISLRIGQHVRHSDYDGKRVTGIVRGLSIDGDRGLQADIVLDAPIVIPARGEGDRDISIWHQHVNAHELSPFDDRDELIAELLEALTAAEKSMSATMHPACALDPQGPLFKARAVIAKTTRSAA